MVRKRAAFLASMVAALAMMLGLTASAAQATPKHYPPPPPSLVVDRGVVKSGASVRATGREFEGRERVFITVTFRAAGSHRYRTVRTAVVRTDRGGRFTFDVRAHASGIVIITARGTSSRMGASAAVYVVNRHKGGGGWTMTPASFTGDTSNVPGLLTAGLGVLALAGSAMVARQTVRRRRYTKS